MGKKSIKKTDLYSAVKRQRLYILYYDMFFNLWMGKYRVEGMNYRANYFLFKSFWDVGSAAIFKKKYLEGEDAVGVARWTSCGGLDGFEMPVEAQLLQLNGDVTIPLTPQKIDETCVVGWCQRNWASIDYYMSIYASKLAAVDMLININEKVQKMPWLINMPEGMEQKIREMYNALDNDEPVLFFDVEGVDLRALISGAPYILDKLYNYKQAYMNEALTFLGVNNLGNVEKKERLITAEAEHNNELIESNSDNFKKPIEEFLERANKTLGFSFKLVENKPQKVNEDPRQAFGREEEEDDDM